MKKKIITGLVSAAILLSLGVSACGGSGEGGEHVHDWVVGKTSATCGEGGEATYYCNGCDESYTEEVSATGVHNFGGGKVCNDCGYVDFSGMNVNAAIDTYGYYIEDVDGSKSYTQGDKAYFGSYPQSLDESVGTQQKYIDLLGTLPTSLDVGSWTSYGYYSLGEVSNYMFYKDVTDDEGQKWRAVYLLNYRPYYSGIEAGADNSYIDNQGFDLNTVYWFKYEPIVWNVLEYANGKLFLSSKYSLDGQPYQALYEGDESGMTIKGTEINANDWENSTIRSFLNNEFFNSAFSQREQLFIQPANLDNKTTGYEEKATYQVCQNNTTDKVFLLSYADVKNVDYGYTSRSMIKSRSFTSYATVQGCRPSGEGTTLDGDPACFYMLRSAGEKNYGICGVNKKGTVVTSISSFSLTESSDGLAVNGDFGVLPALYIRVGKTASGVWEDFTYSYTDSNGDSSEMSCSLYIPSNYTGDKKLPLITYVPDSTYVGSTLKQYKVAQCPSNWLTEEKMSKNPTFFLIVQFTKTSSGTGSGSQGGQLINIIDSVVNNYWVDESRLYLTGQSMGGILDFALNDAYPDKFAATVYVGCQPGGDVGDDQYNSIIAAGKYKAQKFVYIASRKDEKAPYGQDAVEQSLIDANITYGKLYGLDHNGGDSLNTAVKDVLAQGYSQNFFGFTQVTGTGDGTAEHMQSFKYAYAIDAIFDWLMAQHK